jgi:peroxiredoxin Q/BCP
MLKPGDRLPDLTLTAADGARVRVLDLLGARPMVLYFYPKDETAGCTRQACSFRDAYQDFVDAGAQVVGVSRDSPTSHQAFAARHRLPFVLLSDEDESAARAMGLRPTLGVLRARVTFVVDARGVIRDAFSSQVRLGEHARRALALVRTLSAEARGAAPRAGDRP